MNCESARELLSPYHDEELSAETAEEVRRHLEECHACSSLLLRIHAISRAAAKLPDPHPPGRLWGQIERTLGSPAAGTIRPERKRRRLWSLTAALALLIAAGLLALVLTHGDHSHGEHVAVNFDRYLALFPDRPERAQQILVDHYAGEAVTVEEATRRLPYRPIVAGGPPPGYDLAAAYLLQMPCCTCLQTIYSRGDGGHLAVFEHEADQPIWFGDRPALSAQCAGNTCRVVQFNSELAITCPLGMRYVTVVGARNLEEVVRVVEHYDRARRET